MFLENSYFDSIEQRLPEISAIQGMISALDDLVSWKNTPAGNKGAALSTTIPNDLSTTLVLGLLTAVPPAMNSTNSRVNLLATNQNTTNSRVNAIEKVLVDKGWLN